jgi:hypothetical protein
MGLLLLVSAASLVTAATPEDRALAYLEREVPRWSAENKCYSCHNNGDAARALYVAARLGRRVPDKALADTSRWLARPKQWDHNGGDVADKSKDLTDVQFTSALVEALDAGLVKDAEALPQAAERVAGRQKEDGTWRVEGQDLGGPASYGTALATHVARRTLVRADPKKYRDAAARAEAWLLALEVKTVADAAAVLLALDGVGGDDAAKQRRRCLEVIRKGQSKDGGWGPYVESASEPFDTALVVLALSRPGLPKETINWLRRGRAYLVATQEPEGNWTETTRPAGGTSYAQRLSTTGWATLALLATREMP